MAVSSLTAERLRKLFSYDPETGLFTRIANISGAKVGTISGYTSAKGYDLIRVDNYLYRSHRLAWLYAYGSWPESQVDHINGIKNDNRLSNLRCCTNAQNLQNQRKKANNTSGFIGVSFRKTINKFRATIGINGKYSHLGYFDTPEEAHAAYVEAKARLHTFQPTIRT